MKMERMEERAISKIFTMLCWKWKIVGGEI